MLLEVVLLLFGILLLQPCIPILFEHKPAIKLDNLKRVFMAVLYVSLVRHFASILIPAIREYGSPYEGIISISHIFYFDIGMVLLWAVLLIRSSLHYMTLIPTSLALVGIPKDYALPILYRTLAQMGLHYQENIAQITLPEQNIDIFIELTHQELRFRVDKTIDKVFLQRLCEAYQEQYRSEKLPLKKIRASVFLLLGLFLVLWCVYALAATFLQTYFPDWKGFFPALSLPAQVAR